MFYPSVKRSVDNQNIFIECLQCIEQSAKSGYKKSISIQENTIINIHILNDTPLKYMKQELTELKREMDTSKIGLRTSISHSQ